MSKQYGLIIPGQQKKEVISTVPKDISKPSIFNETSSSDDDDRPQFKPRIGASQGPSLMERRMARSVQEKALKEDPTVFQYDELYDAMESKREEEQQTKSNEPKKPKYIGRLIEVAERRKLENELRIERQVQKEREQEGEEFKDKECFVTEAYRKKLEEMRQLEEQEKRDEYLESIGDVTKQQDLDGFYRHLFEQKLGTMKEVKKPELLATPTAADGEEVAYKPIKSGKVPPQRAYRKRRTTDDGDEEDEGGAVPGTLSKETKKVHLSNNIDADSDFSIDSSSSDEDESNAAGNAGGDAKQAMDKQRNIKTESSTTTTEGNSVSASALNLDALKKEKPDKEAENGDSESAVASAPVGVDIEVEPKPKPKRDRSEIWKKRTVGELYEAALQRYYERRAARSA